ncbi:MAG TPA: hypothetical protein VEM58_00550 [Streptosporangiaceae bacterium]|nr:hypothetical protein [Streptosporangiaceae bacterium]
MERDTSRDQSGDQAAWRDLVARLELPSAIDPANAPWPERENLGAAAQHEATDQYEAMDPHETMDPQETKDLRPGTGQGLPTSRSRVIRPAGSMHIGESAQQSPGAADIPPSQESGPLRGLARRRETDDGGPDGPTHPDLGFLDYDAMGSRDADERYVPPHVPPLPKLDPVARGAWTALFGGPGYLFIATTLGWQVPGWAELAAIIAFITGFVILVSRLGDGPSRRDGPDQGAIV